MQFFIEQIALCPRDPEAAIALLKELGMDTWVTDVATSKGVVRGHTGTNVAELAFNYQATRAEPRPLELEVLHYAAGPNWMAKAPFSVSHLGMHCSEEDLQLFRHKFAAMNIPVVQEVCTQSHTNPAIAGERWYRYVIFDTRDILGVDLKFIVRRSSPGTVHG